ncbi:uncharacterized protein LOC125657202 isoform X2 [Ostrea edulis]|uniref:uncharacterized protein LOC125657202 isoform X2 n=1 Tax=Ostrea edulis TaxID=37623 RepID=UPI0024AF0101|nr:uncharacterized protein LOC125657202 isoform X2 [Ostrea edulis]
MQSLLYAGLLFLSAAQPVRTSYLGCFRSALTGKSFTSHQKMYADVCRQFCEKQNAKYYGTHNGIDCTCGDLAPVYRKQEKDCRSPCRGIQNQFCGGAGTESVYINHNYSNGYLGCFQEESDSTPNFKNTSSKSMTVELCKEFCQKQDVPFYALQAGHKCFCRSSPLPTVKKPDGDCRIKCSGNEKDFCGGKRMISIHKNSHYEKGYLGCFRSALTGKSFTSHQIMYVDVCRQFCEKQNAKYYGIHNGIDCTCGDLAPVYRKQEKDCRSPCRGIQNQFCGGAGTESIYINRNYSNGYLGCFQEESDSTPNFKTISSKSMTVELCKEFCQKQDVPFYALQAGHKCFCRSSPLPTVKKPDGDCRIKCSGNEKDFCGGKRMISIHKNSHYEKGYLGCFRSALTGKSFTSHQKMYADVCRQFCEKQNAKYYGIHIGIDCTCGDLAPVYRKQEKDCRSGCRGIKNQFCGGAGTESIYINRNYSNGYLGCFQEESHPTPNFKNTSSKSMTVELCKEFCQKQDVPFYALQAGHKCFCRNSPLPTVKKPDGNCRIKCSGNEKDFCGGKRMISIHKNSHYEKGYLGCFRSALTGKSFTSHQKMYADVCRQFCEKQNAKYYGIHNGIDCTCGDRAPVYRTIEKDCGSGCRGITNQFCGGPGTQSIYINRNYDNDCVKTADGRDYDGKWNKTHSGRTCQSWSSLYPHKHRFTYLPHNYCRNPDGEPQIWCYTTDPKKRWELCGLPMCDCVKTADGRDYDGKWNKTHSGRTCQSWSSLYPHKHRFTYLPHNYCRNPDGEPQIWCYTTDPKKRWELCGLPMCAMKKEVLKDCVKTADGRDYDGKWNKTHSGRTCQSWSSLYPHKHRFTYLPHNYCRNPDGEPQIWCYTTDPKKRWELCGLPMCAMKKEVLKDCVKTADGRNYNGKWNKTHSGRTCQSWSSLYPHKHRFTYLPHNYCRNPDGEPQIWCYTTDPKKRWELCGLPMCNRG